MRALAASLVVLLAWTSTSSGREPEPNAGPPAAGKYVVMVDPGAGDEFLPAAKALAEFHKASLRRFDAGRLDEAFAELTQIRPDYVVFVLPPEKIDVDLAHQILERSTALDDDPFPDFEYGFVTGRDETAALRFVERVQRAWRADPGRKVTLFGSWEGFFPPLPHTLSALKPMKAEGEFRYVMTRAGEDTRRKAAREALESARGKDMLLFFSHGEPDEMGSCFRAKDLREWKVDLAQTILVNCACYNGAPGRWFAPGPKGVADRGVVARSDSVALAVLDSGVVGYFAGIDAWHGPLAMQVFGHVFDDGMRLGQAAKAMSDRLALEFLPGRIHFGPALRTPERFAGEGTANRRHNGAGMIFYGDPALAPFARSASRLGFAEWTPGEVPRFTIRLGTRPLLDGQPAQDFMIPQSRLTDYYSIKTADYLKELALEMDRVLPLPPGVTKAPALRIKSARSGGRDVPTGPLQVVVERTPRQDFLHVRVPLAVRAVGSEWPFTICKEGITVEIEGELAP
jgi:hypothetical protein